MARFRAFGVAELVGGIVLAGVIGRTTNFESGRALAVTLSALTAVVTAGWLLGLANALWLTVAAYWLAQRSRATSAPSSPPG